jgi:hypothetical protein
VTRFVHGLAHASFYQGQGLHHTAVCLVLRLCINLLCLSARYVAPAAMVLLADVQCAQAASRCVNWIAERRLVWPFRAALVVIESPTNVFVLDCRAPHLTFACCVGLISFAPGDRRFPRTR